MHRAKFAIKLNDMFGSGTTQLKFRHEFLKVHTTATNVRFPLVNVRFFLVNVRFFKREPYCIQFLK